MNEIVYPYHDEHGIVRYEVVRGPNKSFKQRRPDGSGGYINNLNGVDSLPYRLPELIRGVADDKTVYISEGEKDVDRLRSLGLCATGTSGGANRSSVPPQLLSALKPATKVVIIGDNDGPGDNYAHMVANAVMTVCLDVRIISPIPGSSPRGDVSDWFDAGATVHDLLDLVAATQPSIRGEASQCEPTDDDGKHSDASACPASDKSQASRLAHALEQQNTELFHDQAGEGYASFTRDGHLETLKIDSSQFKKYCRHVIFRLTGKMISATALSDALGVVAAKAEFDGPKRYVALRSARIGNVVYIDLANDDWQIAEISSFGVEIIPAAKCEVRFSRHAGMSSLPFPQAAGTLAQLDPFLPTDHQGRVLIKMWLLASLYSQIPQPVLNLTGPQGSGKSTVARRVRALIDPNVSPLRSEPHDERDIAAAARNNYACVFDNISKLPNWLSDTLCRLSTGGGFGARALFTNDDEHIVDALRPVVLTAIENVVIRGDLADRTLNISLDLINANARKTEEQIDAEFETARPFIFGALLSALSSAIRAIPLVERSALARMADFDVLGRAAATAIGLDGPGAFAQLYCDARATTSSDVLDASPLTPALRKLAESDDGWTGTYARLFRQIVPDDDRERRIGGWPRTPRGLSADLSRLIPDLRAMGIEITISSRDRTRTRNVRIKGKNISSIATSATSATSEEREAIGSDLLADVLTFPDATSAPEVRSLQCGAGIADVADVERDVHIW